MSYIYTSQLSFFLFGDNYRVEFDVVRAFFDANDNMINVVGILLTPKLYYPKINLNIIIMNLNSKKFNFSQL